MDSKPEMQRGSYERTSAKREELPTYAQAAAFKAPQEPALPVWRRPSFTRRALFLGACMMIIGIMLTGLCIAIDVYKNQNATSANPNNSGPKPTNGAPILQARGVDVVARQAEHPTLKLFACPDVAGLSCGWGQACSPGGCIDLHPNAHNVAQVLHESSEQAPYASSSSATQTDYPADATPVNSYTSPITLPTDWGFGDGYTTLTTPTEGASGSASSTGYGTGGPSSTGGTESVVPTETTAENPPTDTPTGPDAPNAAKGYGEEAAMASVAALALAFAAAGFLL